MTFRLKIDTDNAAFGDTPEERADEVARLLLLVARKLDEGAEEGDIRDANGNRCGTFTLEN